MYVMHVCIAVYVGRQEEAALKEMAGEDRVEAQREAEVDTVVSMRVSQSHTE